MVNTYYKDVDGETSLSTNFKVKEFACKDGSDIILIDSDLVTILQHLRNLIMSAITITSGYRNEKYNAKIGGAKSSQHMLGKASDLKCKYGSKLLCRASQLLGAGGIGNYPYSPFCHCDTRKNKSYWVQEGKNSKAYSVYSFMDKSHIQKVQDYLNITAFETGNSNYFCGASDGIIGKNTRTAFAYFCDYASDNRKAKMIAILK